MNGRIKDEKCISIVPSVSCTRDAIYKKENSIIIGKIYKIVNVVSSVFNL